LPRPTACAVKRAGLPVELKGLRRWRAGLPVELGRHLIEGIGKWEFSYAKATEDESQVNIVYGMLALRSLLALRSFSVGGGEGGSGKGESPCHPTGRQVG